MITQKEIDAFWRSYWWIIFKWNLVSIVGFLSGGVVIAFILKHLFKVKFEFWWLNDTVDGDFGSTDWLKDNDTGFKLLNAFLWWWRNHNWNYISKYNPDWEKGENERYKILSNTTGVHYSQLEDGLYTWLTKDFKKEAKLYVAYRINGKVYCRYSEVYKDVLGRWHQTQKGAGGRRYKLNLKPIF